MALANVGFATVQIVPSFKGMQKQIRAELSGMGDLGGQSFGDRFGSSLKTHLSRAFKVGFAGVVGASGYIGFKGWDRLLNIEDAEAKLRGLGHTAETIEEVTKRATAAVDGTPYALDKAMTVASGLLASGIAPGEELERVLGLVADTATLAGADLGEMGSIWNRIFASGRVQAEELNMIGDRGIPIFQLLADHFDTTVDGVRKMGAEGKISAEDFAAAMSTYEGAAKQAGDTTRGAWANFNTSLAKLGAEVLEPIQPVVKDLLDNAKVFVKDITPSVKTFVEDAIAGVDSIWSILTRGEFKGADSLWGLEEDSPVVRALFTIRDVFLEIRDRLVMTRDWIVDNRDALEDAAIAAGSFVAAFKISTGVSSFVSALPGLLRGVAGGFTAINAALKANWIYLLISAIVAAGVLIWQNWDVIGPKIQAIYQRYLEPVFSKIKELINTWVLPAFEAVRSFVVDTLWPAMQTAWDAITSAVTTAWTKGIRPAFEALWGFIQDRLIPVFTWLWEKVVKPVWNFISWQIQVSWNVVRLVFDLIVFGIQHVGDFFSWLWGSVVKPVWEKISAAISWAWENVIKPVFDAIDWVIRNVLAPAFTWFRDSVITPVWDGISSGISWVWENGIRPVFSAIKSFLENTLGPAFTRFRDIAVGAFEGLANLALDPIQFLVNTVYTQGIKKAFDAVAEAVGSSARLPSAHIDDFNFTRRATSSGPLVGGTISANRAFAKGGFAAPGWALVGEEGPELVNFDRPGRVYTADETAMALRGAQIDPGLIPDRLYDRADASFALSALRSGDPDMLALAAGGTERDALLPAGGLWDSLGATWSKTWRGAANVVTNVGGKVFEFVRGKLADAASLILSPLTSTLNAMKGGAQLPDIFASIGTSSIDNVLSWIRGIDAQDEKEALANATAGTLDAVAQQILESKIPLFGGSARPVSGGRLTSLFGPRWGGMHAGVDWAVPTGTPVRAWRPGVVRRAGWNSLAGRTGFGIEVGHRDGLGSYYGHLSQILAKVGQAVQAGQVIGRSGNTGNSTGPHLHFEISKGNPQNPVNPLPYLHDEGGLLMPGLSLLLNNTRKPEYVLNDRQWRDISGLAGSRGFPDEVTLMDMDGSILTRARVVAKQEYEHGANTDRRWS